MEGENRRRPHVREYARVSPNFWTGDTGREIRLAGLDVQVVALYLITSPHANVIGLYRLPLIYLSHETGVPLERCSNAVRTLSELCFCSYDERSEVVWVHEMASWQLGKSGPETNHAKGAAEQFAAVPQNAFTGRFYEKYAGRIPLKERRSNTDGAPPERRRNAVGTPFEHRSNNSDSDSDSDSDKRQATSDSETTLSPSLRDGSGSQGSPLVPIPGQPKQEPPAEPPERRGEEIRHIFEHYRKYHPRAHRKPTSKQSEWLKIRARLDEGYTPDDLKLAIDGCHKSPFHMGENDQQRRYDSLELIVRDGSKVRQFLELAEHPPPPVMTIAEQRGRRAAEQWLARSSTPAFDQATVVEGT